MVPDVAARLAELSAGLYTPVSMGEKISKPPSMDSDWHLARRSINFKGFGFLPLTQMDGAVQPSLDFGLFLGKRPLALIMTSLAGYICPTVIDFRPADYQVL